MFFYRIVLSASATGLGIVLAPVAASAQVATPPAPAEKPSTAPNEPDATQGIGDIIVTASRRSDTVQKSALAITALSGDLLARQGVSQPEELNKLATGLTISKNGASTQVFLRGVGSFAVSSYADSAVAFSVDGVFYGFPTAVAGSFYDLQRIEVLKGPQGTLYGRNATAGAINLIPNHPTFDTNGTMSVDVGNYGLFKVDGAINIALSDTLAVRASGYRTRRGGYFSDGYGNDVSEAGRLQALFRPTDRLSVLLAGEYSYVGGKGTPFVPVPALGSDPWEGPSTATSNSYIQAVRNAGLPIPLAKDDGFIRVKAYNARAEVNWNLGFANLTVLPSYQKIDSSSLSYPGFSFTTDDSGDQHSLEARLSSVGSGPLKWIVGAYDFRSNISSLIIADQGLVGSTPQFQQKVHAKAVFGETTYSVTKSLRLTGGLRYSDEARSQRGTVTGKTLTPFGQIYSAASANGDLSKGNLTYKAGIEFDAGSRSLMYASIASGFKAGGFQADSAPNTFKPEKLYAYTLGSKNRFFGNKLQANVELFYWDYRDHQEIYLSPANSGGFVVAPHNVGDAYVWGGNLDLQWRPTKADQFTAQVEFLQSKYKNFKYDILTAVAPVPGLSTGCAVAVVSPGTSRVDCSGKPFARAPKIAATVSYGHTFDLGNDARLIVEMRSRISSAYYTSVDYIAASRQGPFTRSDASLTLELEPKLSVTAYIRNIEKSAVHEGGFQAPFTPGVVYSALAAPRTFGVRIAKAF
ncbi:TonB-dependent receptor [Sphingomonas sp. RB3P16]|uniref:TonB-dependent receptor n=1 Tax=Parasphingomonas frigoris TaxID=3096163 RepID=UPI002FC6B1C7